MRLIVTLILCTIAVLASSCINENSEGCLPKENLILRFSYNNNNGTDIFPETIQKVDIFIFDQQGKLVLQQTKEQTELADFSGSKLELPPGKYRIVCWGNAFDKTGFTGVAIGQKLENVFLHYTKGMGTTFPVNGDPLHYAPSRAEFTTGFWITIPDTEIVMATIPFNSAHIKIEVYIKGLQDKSPQGELLAPIVEVTEMPEGYTFDRQPFGSSISFRDFSSYKQPTEPATITFHTPLFTPETPAHVLIRKASDNLLLTDINLSHFIKTNKIEISETAQTIIPILVEYKQTAVVVSVPEWIQKPTKPEL